MSSGGLDRLLKLIATHNGVYKRVVATYGMAAVIFLMRARRRRELGLWVGNTSAVAIMFLYPNLKRLTSRCGVPNRHFSFSLTVAASLALIHRLPNWLPLYLTVESISGYLLSLPALRRLLHGLEKSRLVRLRQLMLCLLIPTLRKSPWMDKGSLVRNFALFYSVSCLVSLYHTAKGCIRRKKRSSPPTHVMDQSLDEWPLVSTSFKPLIDKLAEIQEITACNRQTLTETFMNSALARNMIPSLRWALWGQFCVRVVSQAKLGHTRLMKSVVLMLGFMVLDQDRQMDISPRILCYLVRSQLKEYFEPINGRLKVLLTLVFSNLALYNTKF